MAAPVEPGRSIAEGISPAEAERLRAAIAEAQALIQAQAQRIRYLETLSHTDELTGLMNRRGFILQLEQALAAATRHGEGGVLLMVDLDRFKPINDTYGHAAGDEVLSHVGAMLLGRVRRSDTVARLGGDEFAILLPGADIDIACARAEAIDRGLNGLIVDWNGIKLAVGASVGTVVYCGEDTVETVLERADQRMYAVKRARRQPRGDAD